MKVFKTAIDSIKFFILFFFTRDFYITIFNYSDKYF